ncbi:Crp/Fnr family transcriptional regulator [Tenacibaculum sp. M341]|uniref:Crp/Fnr family transcriptional regulator n=1 Tax=Tenacibaculum sp. M341 TaxID=2530339 RepID=UPI00105279C8|nr:Crp/Fnr family transcriptional regulator [Tenacibaculum sp. M341]TCI91373.1 Crp/Fnr family transcriptional regulator [Tenacibaculum sp. M341]
MKSASLQVLLQSFDFLTEDEKESFQQLATFRKIPKGDFLIKGGSVCTEVAFVMKGILRSFYLSSTEEEVTYCFRFSNSFSSAYSSFLQGVPSQESLEAITDVEVLVWSKEQIQQLETKSCNWTRVLKILTEYEYIELEKRIFILQRESAENRYADLLQNHPNLIKEIPLNYLASYLGITQRHLSRIRKAVY